MRRARGFSLIELLIVVAIILVIAAIAVPSYLAARIQANESAAVGSLRALNEAQAAYSSAFPTVGYASTLSALGGNQLRSLEPNQRLLRGFGIGGRYAQRIQLHAGRGERDPDRDLPDYAQSNEPGLYRVALFLLVQRRRRSSESNGRHLDLR